MIIGPATKKLGEFIAAHLIDDEVPADLVAAAQREQEPAPIITNTPLPYVLLGVKTHREFDRFGLEIVTYDDRVKVSVFEMISLAPRRVITHGLWTQQLPVRK